MIDYSKQLIGISFSLVVLSGCSSESSPHDNMSFSNFETTAKTTASTQQNSNSSEEDTQEKFTILSSGEQPASGVFGPKQFNVIDSEEALLEKWYNYSDDALPAIDFEKQSVVLWDRGRMNLNNCRTLPVLKGAEVSQIQDKLTVATVKLTQYCQNVEIACTEEYTEGSPYMLLSVPKAQEIIFQEALTVVSCDKG